MRSDDGFEELYNLAADPYELDNKVNDSSYANNAATLRSLRDSLNSCAGLAVGFPRTRLHNHDIK